MLHIICSYSVETNQHITSGVSNTVIPTGATIGVFSIRPLVNNGNTCFMNAAVQFLGSCRIVRDTATKHLNNHHNEIGIHMFS